MKHFSRRIALLSTLAIGLNLSIPLAFAVTSIGTNVNIGGGTLSDAGLITAVGGISVTGQTSANVALNALLPAQATHATQFLQTDGANTSWVAGGSGTVMSVTLNTGTTGLTGGSTITTSGTWTLGGALAVANGGTNNGSLAVTALLQIANS